MKKRRNLVSLREAVISTGVARRTFQDWMKQGRLTAYAVAGDRQRYLDRDELARLLEPQAVRKAKRR